MNIKYADKKKGEKAMAVWCEKDGNNIMITCPQDFESLVDPGVYNAMREYFGFGVIGNTLKSDPKYI